jgi:hypothetical protein
VYGGDDHLQGGGLEHAPRVHVLFRITADADPDVLCRVANVLSLSNQPPVSGSLRTITAGEVVIAVELPELLPETAERLRRKLAQLTCVVAVEANVVCQ